VLQQPLVLLLENTRNDRRFLETITRQIQQFDLGAYIANGMVRVESKGGTENHMWLSNKDRTPEELFRMWVMSDSDSLQVWRGSEQHLGELAQTLREKCAMIRETHRVAVHLHILERRSIENYLPLPALQKWSEKKRGRKERYDAFASLKELAQRAHYNMKDGFDGDEPRKAKAGGLYDDVSTEVRSALKQGFDEREMKIVELFESANLFIRPQWLGKDGQYAEAVAIAESIREHL
jgi:hypothetical protein